MGSSQILSVCKRNMKADTVKRLLLIVILIQSSLDSALYRKISNFGDFVVNLQLSVGVRLGGGSGQPR